MGMMFQANKKRTEEKWGKKNKDVDKKDSVSKKEEVKKESKDKKDVK